MMQGYSSSATLFAYEKFSQTSRRFSPVLVLAFIFSSSHCRKDPPSPEFYFRCNVDGNLYIPNNCANCRVGKLLGDTVFLINGNRDYETIAIGIIKLDKIPITNTSYHLSQNPQQKAIYKNSTDPRDAFNTDSLRTGQIIITLLDKTKKIIEGSFSFQAYNPVQNKIVQISKGRFRLEYTIY